MFHRLSLWLLTVLIAAPAATGFSGDPLRLQLFSGLDGQAVGVGDTVQLEVEALAVPASQHDRNALVEAFSRLDVAQQVGTSFEVVREDPTMLRVTNAVVELRRSAVLRVLDPAVLAVPGLSLVVGVGERSWTYHTRSLPIRPYLRDTRVEEAARSVVSVVASGTVDGVGFERIGSAFLMGDDALVTAYHVIAGASRIRAVLPGGEEADASRVWALDAERDVAVLHVDADEIREAGVRPLVVAPEDARGLVAFTAGWPDRQQHRTVAVRFDDLVVDERRFRVAANAVLPGDSGGPLLDETGRVLGVVVSGRSTMGREDLLREDICLASDPSPALDQYREATEPVGLRRALRDAAGVVPAAQAHEAVGAIQVPARGADRRSHVASLLDALHQSPNDPVLQFLAGTTLEEVGETRIAVGALTASRRAGYAPAAYSLAHHLMAQGLLAEAATLFGEIAGEGAYVHLGSFGEAQALVALGRHDEAERALRIVLDHDARFAPALYLLGLVRLAQGREIEAAALTVRLADDPGWADALRLPIVAPALRMPTLDPLPRVAMR